MPEQMPLIENISTHKQNIALANYYGTHSIRRDIVDGQRGYTVTDNSGKRWFCFSLAAAFRHLMNGLGHNDDRDMFMMGEPEKGNAW